ncbi:MAG: site-specific DNA-methyltransferase [archaeon]|jgi:site-specific DNA-methyltransferase (adenine-specific)|nr:site-specific DNA-methyltransferase [archaeon]MCK9439568.1 site-specific DNA-methyltransferase [Patescibacteria group bacterium]MDD4662933.1 site-specific DNA-methyltransferase [Candidatus ainarchaeum sp.]
MNYYNSSDFKLYKGNCIDILKKLPENSVDLIFADPPYFLSNNGISCKAGKMVSVNKAKWDVSSGFEKDLEFNLNWLSEAKRVLKDNGSIWVSGTMHNIYQIGYGFQKLDYHILNEISWFKPNAPPNLSCRFFTHSHETLLWARKDKSSKHKFNYNLMKEWDDNISESGKQMRSVWSIPLTSKFEKINGPHPTQKPIELLKRIILSSTDKGDLVLDPFNGSGTTGIVSKMYGRKYIGIDLENKYLDLTIKRLDSIKNKIIVTERQGASKF